MNINSAASSLFRPASAESFFGSTSANAIISAGQAASGTSDQQSAKAIISAQTREINRIRGYKLDLTPTDKQNSLNLRKKSWQSRRRPPRARPGRMSLMIASNFYRKLI